ncbi:MAG: hypothetical protein M1813_003142 [Trichoglossum hirsutum]|nr:MAG: hypothetical protein M1813_003142 [Trichoglossum hirsutum]
MALRVRRVRSYLPFAGPQLQLRRQFMARFPSASAVSVHKTYPRRRYRVQVIATTLALSATAGLILHTAGILPANLFGTEPALNKQTFTPFKLMGKESVGDGSSAIFTFEGPGAGCMWDEAGGGNGKIYSVQVAMEEMQVCRKYTPLPPPSATNPSTTTTIRLLIRNSTPTGLVSPYIHALPLGARVPIRGPFVEYEIPRDVEEVVCLVGGTGVAVALQAVRGILDAPAAAGTRKPTVRVVWACRNSDTDVGCADRGPHSWWSYFPAARPPPDAPTTRSPILRSLHALQAQHPTLTISQHVDHAPSSLRPQTLLSLLNNNNNNNDNNNRLLLVSGPPGFLSHWVGPKAWIAGRGEETQGPLGGVVGERGGRRWVVWKL